ncbi:MAG: hypothetical protein ACR5K7_01805 [Symbiopectobacterium sp.]
MACLHVLFIRHSSGQGAEELWLFPKSTGRNGAGGSNQTFIGQFYLKGSFSRAPPSEILLDFALPEKRY